MRSLFCFFVCCIVLNAYSASDYIITTDTSSALTGETGVTCIEFSSLDYIKNGWIEAGKPSKVKIKGPIYGAYNYGSIDMDIATTITYLDLSEATVDDIVLSTVNFTYIPSQENDDLCALNTLVLPTNLTKLYVNSLQYYDGGGHYSIQDIYTTSSTPFYVQFYNKEGYFHVPEGYKESWGSQQDLLATIVDTPVKTVILSAGNLVSKLTATELQTIDALIIKGEVNAVDFALLGMMPDLNALRIEASINAYFGTEGPNSLIKAYAANEIPSFAFQNNHNLKRITYSNVNHISVGDYAFDGCENFSFFDAKVYGRIGDFAFRNTNLRSINIAENIENIGKNPFMGCINNKTTDSKTRYFHNHITGETCNYAFYEGFVGSNGQLSFSKIDENDYDYNDNADWMYTHQLILSKDETKLFASHWGYEGEDYYELSIPINVKHVMDYALSDINVRTVYINGNLEDLGDAFLYKCRQLQYIFGQSSFFTTENGVLYSADMQTLYKYPCASYGNYSLPSSVTLIKKWAFEGTNHLSRIYVESSVPPVCEEFAFENVDLSHLTLYVPVGSKNVYEETDVWKDFGNIIEYVQFEDESVKAICLNNWDADNDERLSVVEASSVKSIGTIFQNNASIKSFEELKYFTGLKSLDFYAFSDCKALESISIPVSITQIGGDAFYDCNNLKKVEYSSIEHLCSISFGYGISNPTGYAKHLYIDGQEITNVIIPEGITRIGRETFLGCEFLKAITIPYGITEIGEYAFQRCKGLTDINLPESIEIIDFAAFEGCTGLTYITIPNGVTTINQEAFKNCTGLTSITIPSSVTNIGNFAFSECSKLTSVTVKWAEPLAIEEIFSSGYISNATLYVPAGSKAAYEAADYWKEFKEIVEVAGPELQTDNVLSASAPTILTGKEASLSLNLTNEDEIIMTEFYMQLPDGITIEEDEDGYPIVTINSERENKHVIEVNRNSEGLYHFLCYSSKNNAFRGNEGELFNMNLVCAEGVAAGTYTATVRNIIMSDVDRNELTQSDFTFDITVLDVAMGDANSDGRINGMDIVEMVDYIMERPSNTFVFDAADLTGDGRVNGMDLVELVSLVMAQGAQASASALPRREGTLQTEKLGMGTLKLKGNANGELVLSIEDPNEFILAQMVVEVSGGALTDVTTDNAHVATWSPIDENKYAVLAYSAKNRSFTTNDCLLTFFGCEGNITVKDVMLVNADREARYFADVTYNGTTGIEPTPDPSLKGREVNRQGKVYNLNGQRVSTSEPLNLSTLPKGVYIVNGKKVVVK